MSLYGAKNNLKITVRERGKIVTRREGHNIWLNGGRTFLTQVMAFQSFGPDVPEQTAIPKYIGFGIGGQKQNAFGIADVDPCLSHYPGPNNNLDIDPTLTTLERPARISWAAGPSTPTGVYGNYTYPVGDVWLQQLTLPTHPTIFSLEWSCSFSTTDFSTTPFLAVPLSEIGLVLSDASPNVYNNPVIAYDTFDTITKTANFSVDVTWTVRF